MLRVRFLLSVPAVLAVGCTPPPEAPQDLEELSEYIFAEFESDEPVLAAGVLNLETFLLEFDANGALSADTARQDRSWSLPFLPLEALEGVEHPDDVNPAAQLPVALAFRSAYPGQDHVDLVGLVDQTPVEADTSNAYERTFETDFSCFQDGSCDRLEVRDAIHRLSPGVLDLNYEQNKHYRHVTYGDEGKVAVVSRSWIPQRYTNDDGDFIDQWSGLNVYIPDGNETIRYSTLWGASSLTLDDDFLINQVAAGIEEAFQNTEAYLGQ